MEDLLDELFNLTQMEYYRELTTEESSRYAEIVDILQKNNIKIPFGVEI